MMNRNKKVIESMTVTSALLVMTTITALGGSTEDMNSEPAKEKVTAAAEVIALAENGSAGIVNDLSSIQADAFEEGEFQAASIAPAKKENVSEGVKEENKSLKEDENDLKEESDKIEVKEETPDLTSGAVELQEVAAEADLLNEEAGASETSEQIETPDLTEVALEEASEMKAEQQKGQKKEEQQDAPTSEWENLVMADVEEDMNIRTAPDETSDPAGKFYRGDVAEVLSVDGEWTQITSGNVTGYVKNDYLVYGEEANALANEVCSLYATVNTDGLRLRSEPSEEASVVTTTNAGEKLKVDKEAEPADGWVAVYTSDATAYVSAEYVGVELNLGTALNSEEVAAKEAREAEAKAAAEGTKKKSAASASSDDVTLLGALIQCEAGSGSYEGMVAVGAVVMNRVRSGAYPSSISGVIYQGGQFTPALNGGVASVMASGVRSACIQAAREALNGVDNTNGALSFRSASSGCAGTLIGANVFF